MNCDYAVYYSVVGFLSSSGYILNVNLPTLLFFKAAILSFWFNLPSSNRAELQRSDARAI